MDVETIHQYKYGFSWSHCGQSGFGKPYPILDRWVLGWRRDVEVLEPASLLKSIRAHVEGMYARLAPIPSSPS
jgi:hypothetical protein